MCFLMPAVLKKQQSLVMYKVIVLGEGITSEAYCRVDTHALAAPGVSAHRKYSFFCGVPISS